MHIATWKVTGKFDQKAVGVVKLAEGKAQGFTVHLYVSE